MDRVKNKIGVVTGIYPPDIGGPATYIPKLADFLLKKGNYVSLLTLGAENNRLSSTDQNFISIKRDQNKIMRMTRTIFEVGKITSYCQQIFANGLFEEVAISKLLFRNRKFIGKIVGDPIWERFRNKTNQNVSIEIFNTPEFKIPLIYRLQRKLLVWSLNKFDNLTTPSSQLKEMIERWGVRKPIQVITNGVICSNPYSGQKEYDVVTVSRLTNWKNIDLVINACSEIGLSLAIVGDGPEMSQLKKLAATANASIKFFGELDQEGVSQVLRESCIYILFSNYEGLSFSLLEAMMFGKPVIVSDVPGNRDVIEHGVTGLVVPVNSHQKLVEALRYLAEHPELANSLGNKAHKVAKNKFCIEKNLDRINSLLTEKSK